MTPPPTSQAGSARRLLGITTLGVLLTACASPPRSGDAPTRRNDPPPPGPGSGIASLASPSDNPLVSTAPAPDQTPTPHEAVTLPAPPVIDTRVHRFTTRGIAFTVLTFDHRHFHLSVLDNEHGPGTGAITAKTAAKTSGSLAAINGGFFTPAGNPLGLVIENGNPQGALGTSSLGAGIYFHDPDSRRSGLIRREAWKTDRSRTPETLLQSGPFLVEHGRPLSGLSKSRPRPRSFLLWDAQFGWALGHAGSTTLAQLASALAAQPIPGFTIRTVLNLDGGSSSDLWISSSVNGGPVSTRRFWNKPVRNYLLLTKSSP